MTWNRNTTEIVKKAYRRMQLLNRAAKFTTKTNDLKSIYLTFVRSILEQSAVVWHSGLSKKNRKDLERVQKTGLKIILGNKFTTYKNGLKMLNLDTLDERRRKMCLKFAQNCLKKEKVKSMFSKHKMELRKTNKFEINKLRTRRYQKSAIPYMQELLNNYQNERRKLIKEPD